MSQWRKTWEGVHTFSGAYVTGAVNCGGGSLSKAGGGVNGPSAKRLTWEGGTYLFECVRGRHSAWEVGMWQTSEMGGGIHQQSGDEERGNAYLISTPCAPHRAR
jgi:hypothetical protein